MCRLRVRTGVVRRCAGRVPDISIFYYPWYGTPAKDGSWEHWVVPGGSTLDIASNYFPARGLYSSSDPRRRPRSRCARSRATGVQEVVSSWWGWGSPEDRRLPLVIRTAARGRPERRGPPRAVPRPRRSTPSRRTSTTWRRSGSRSFYVYRPFDIDAQDWAALREPARARRRALRADRARRARRRRQVRRLYTYDILLWGADTFARLCRRRTSSRLALPARPSVPGYDAIARDRRPRGSRPPRRGDVRRDVEERDPRRSRTA